MLRPDGVKPGQRVSRPGEALVTCPPRFQANWLLSWGPGSPVLLPQLLARDLRGEMTLPVSDECQPSLQSSTLGLGVTQILSLTQVLPSGWAAGGLLGVPRARLGHRIPVREQKATRHSLVLAGSTWFCTGSTWF